MLQSQTALCDRVGQDEPSITPDLRTYGVFARAHSYSCRNAAVRIRSTRLNNGPSHGDGEHK